MTFLIDFLANNPLLLMFVVIGLGYLVGNIKVAGFSLGVSAVLFVGIAFGALDPRLGLPEGMYIAGLVLFVYAIGLQSAPGFFASFQKRGFRTNLVATGILGASALVAVVFWKFFGISAPNIVGLFCGALSNTAALAGTMETIKSLAGKIPPQLYDAYVNAPVVAFGLAYPFGVLGVILWFFVFSKMFKVDFAKEETERFGGGGGEAICNWTLSVSNPAIIGKKVGDVMKFHGGFAISRMKKGEEISVVSPDAVLEAGDQLVAIGTTEALEKARIIFGERAEEYLPREFDFIDYRRIFVSNAAIAGKRIHELHLEKEYGATITRLRRGDVDFVPSPDTILELGDRIRVVTREDNFERVTALFGDSMKGMSETDFLSISLGVVLGVLLGMIPLPLPNGMTFKLGYAGGPLIMALFLGKLERTGRIVWNIPFNASLVMRQIGMVFFLAGIGTKAGYGFGSTFQSGGWTLIAAGAVITTFMTVVTIIVGYKYLKLPMSAVMGMVSGMQTQPACLAYATQQSQNDVPNVWYATVYPASVIAKIILAQVLASMLILMSISPT